VQELSSIKYHCWDCNAASLFSRKNLLRSLEMSFLSRPSDILRKSTGNGGHYFVGPFFLSGFRLNKLAFLSKEPRPSLQETIDLSLVSQLTKGPFLTLSIRRLYARFAHDAHNTFMHCTISVPRSLAVVSSTLGAPSPP